MTLSITDKPSVSAGSGVGIGYEGDKGLWLNCSCGGSRRNSESSAALGAVLVPFNARALENKDHTFFCTTDASGGISYNTPAKRWEGTRFKADGKFLLKMEYLQSHTDKGKYFETDISDYMVSITPAGEKHDQQCNYFYFYAHTENKSVPVMNGGFRCDAVLTDYVFDLDSNRFLSVYLQGYVDGKDNNENTPAVSAGTCTTIE